MNAAAKPVPKSLITSSRLIDYSLTKPQREILRKFDKLDAVFQSQKKRSPCVRLRHVDYVEIDNKVREQSGGQRRLSSLNYRDLPIISATDDL